MVPIIVGGKIPKSGAKLDAVVDLDVDVDALYLFGRIPISSP
jgi:hypothetical protein